MNHNQNVQIYKTTNDNYVVERHLFVKQMMSLLASYDENGAFLFAQRGYGKTSALTGLRAYLEPISTYYSIYVDPTALEDDSLDTILTIIMRQFLAQLSIPDMIFEEPESDFEKQFLPMMHQYLTADHRLVICLDEFDTSKKYKDHFVHPFFLWFKNIEKKLQGELFVILTGGHQAYDLVNIYVPLFNHFRLHCLQSMNLSETFALVRHTERNNSIQWPEKIVKNIQLYSGGNPVLIEAISRELRTLPYGSSPEHTFSGVMMRCEKHLKWIWDGLNTDEKIVAACISENHSLMTQWQIEQRLDETQTSLFYDRLKRAIQNLEVWQIIECRPKGFILRCQFLSTWIQNNHPIQSILEDIEDLPQVSDNLYQAAYRLFQSKRVNDAIEVGRHIIRIYPEHVEANQMVADILISQDHCIDAQKILEHLHKINPEAAKTRLVNALRIQANALEALYSYTVSDYRQTPINSHLKNIKLRYAEQRDQNNHLLIVYEKILALAPDLKEIQEKYIQLILVHQKIKDYKRKIAYEKDVLSHELNAYLLTEATSKVKQLQNRILFCQIYLKALNTLLSKDYQKSADLFVRVVYMDEKCKDARRFLYISKHYSPEVERAIEESLSLPLPSNTPTSENSEDSEIESDPISSRTRQKHNLMLWIFLIILIIVAAYVMMDGTLK